jgi:glycosyltransferase involved in cell wall biosynthesis
MGVSVFCTRDLAADGFPASRLSVIHNGVQTPAVNTPREAMRSSLGIAPSTLLLASVGALVDWKRVDVLLSALESLHPMLRARVQLLVVGEGPRMAALQAQAAGQPVQFTGWRTDVGDLLNAADVIATGATREAFGLTIVEAAALGRPALAAAAGGLPEVVVHGHSGLLFESGCPLACADAIKRLLNEPGLLTRLGQASLARYVECFTVQHMGAQVLALGDRLVSEPSAGRIVRVIWLLRLATGATLLRLRGNRPS